MATRISLLVLLACLGAVFAQGPEGPPPPRLIIPGAFPAPDNSAPRGRFLTARQRRPGQERALLPTPTPALQTTLPPRPVDEEPEEYDDEEVAPTTQTPRRPITLQVSSPVGVTVAELPVRQAAFRPERPALPVARQQPQQQQAQRQQPQLPQQIFRTPPQQQQQISRQQPQHQAQQVFRQPQQPQQQINRPQPQQPQQVSRQPQQPQQPQQVFRQPQQPPQPQQVFRQPQQPQQPQQVFRQPQQPQQVLRQQPAVKQPQQYRPSRPVARPPVDEDDEEDEVVAPRQPLRQSVQQSLSGVKPNKVQRVRKPVAQVLRKYREDHPDGSITWGYENDDGSFKEETIGIDCVVRGKYGYVDPDGVRREYDYSSGTPCDRAALEAEEAAAAAGGAGSGYMDYETGEFVLPGGQTIDMSGVNKHKSRRPALG